MSGDTKWSANTGQLVTDVSATIETVRKAVGRCPSTLLLSADAAHALSLNKEVRSYLPQTVMVPVTQEQLKSILKVPNIIVGESIWTDEAGASHDV